MTLEPGPTVLEFYFAEHWVDPASRAGQCFVKFLRLPLEQRLAIDLYCCKIAQRVRNIRLDGALELLGALGFLEGDRKVEHVPWQKIWKAH